jgi:hypothetical protein
MADKRMKAEPMNYGLVFGEAKQPEVTSASNLPVRPDTRLLACKRHPVKKLLGLIPVKYLETLEQNQQIASCCRHPEDHDIEAWKSRPEETAPDIYIFYCKCGRKHRRFCIGGGEERPFWEIG